MTNVLDSNCPQCKSFIFLSQDDCEICGLVDWKNSQRKDILLKAAFDILKKCDDSIFVADAMGETAFWDGAECDGHCLMTEIKELLNIED